MGLESAFVRPVALKDNIGMVKSMVLEFILGRTIKYTKGIGKEMQEMELEFTTGMMEIDMRDYGKMEKEMVLVSCIGLVDNVLKGNGRMIQGVEREYNIS